MSMNTKQLIPILAVAFISLFSSCKREVVHETVVKEITKEVAATVTEEVTVRANDWILAEDENYYFATFDCSSLTKDVDDYGAAIVYLYEDGRWNLLPYVRPYYSDEMDDTWAENIRFDWEHGKITFIVQDLDGGLPENIELMPDLYFKICIIL